MRLAVFPPKSAIIGADGVTVSVADAPAVGAGTDLLNGKLEQALQLRVQPRLAGMGDDHMTQKIALVSAAGPLCSHTLRAEA
jgi:hypothetical protein